MKRAERIYLYLTDGKGGRVAIRSSMVATKIRGDKQTIDDLSRALSESQAERASLQIAKELLLESWWVRLGYRLRLLRVT